MSNIRTDKAVKIISWNIILQLAIVISGLILPRFFLIEYGSEINGLISSIKQFMTYFSVVSSGIGIACITALFRPLAENNAEHINKVLSATAIFFKRSGYIFISLLSALVLIYPLLIQTSLSNIQLISLILILSSGSIIEYMILNKYRVLTTADQKMYVEAKINAEGIILNLICSIILIKLHLSVLLVQFVVTVVYLFRTFRLINYVKKNYPSVSFKEKVDTNIIPNLWPAFSYQISTILISYSPVILITFLCGLKEVSVYSIYNMVFSALFMVINVFSSGLAPSFGSVVVQGNKTTLNKSFSTFTYMFYCIGFVCFACAYKLILPFVAIYTRGITDINYYQPMLSLLFVINGVNTVLRMPALTMVEATGRYKDNVVLNVSEAILGILLSIFLTIRFGLIGVLMGPAVVGPARTIIYIIFLYKRIIIGFSLLKVFTRIACNIICLIIIGLLPINMPTETFVQWGIYACAIFVSSFILIVGINSLLDKASAVDAFKRIYAIIN